MLPFQALSPPVEVVFDNTAETPPALPYVICLISYRYTIRHGVVSVTDGPLEQINGNLQLSMLRPTRARHESFGRICHDGHGKVMNSLYDWGNLLSEVKVTVTSMVRSQYLPGESPLCTGDND